MDDERCFNRVWGFRSPNLFLRLNRYRQGLETCPQAKTSKSGHAIFFSFFRRVRATSMTQRGVENTHVHFWTFSPVSVNHPFFEFYNSWCTRWFKEVEPPGKIDFLWSKNWLQSKKINIRTSGHKNICFSNIKMHFFEVLWQLIRKDALLKLNYYQGKWNFTNIVQILFEINVEISFLVIEMQLYYISHC